MNIGKIFIEQELKNVTDANLKKFLMSCIDRFPEYFWKAPASREKYHPQDERGEGGLVLHTRRVCRLSMDMVYLYALNMWEKDVLIAAAVLHDSFQKGVPPNDTKTSDPLHPLYPRIQFPYAGDASRFIDQKIYSEIMECVESHLGRFGPSPNLNSQRKLPALFHLIDGIASREHIKIEPS